MISWEGQLLQTRSRGDEDAAGSMCDAEIV